MGWCGDAPPFFPSGDHTAEERNRVDAVIKGRLYLTNFKGAANLEELKRIRCTHIAAVGSEFMRNHENHAATALRVKFWNKDISDDCEQAVAMSAALRDAAGFIHNALRRKRCVVVHCAAGVSRSATVVMGYMLIHCGRALREAFAHVFACRSCIWPNEGFMRALIALEHEVRGTTSLSADEYEHWGNYDGAAIDEWPASVEPSTCVSYSKEARRAAAVLATEEAQKCRSEACKSKYKKVRRINWITRRLRIGSYKVRNGRVMPIHNRAELENAP
mmetsp:Transcript_65205/g.108339  ORF Transcript_65205/g.108339 Transcript_65205/m.108339 type:complete len:275 (+) Transcript_65205:134-958(+)